MHHRRGHGGLAEARALSKLRIAKAHLRGVTYLEATAGSIMNAKGYTGGMSKRKGLRFESIDGDSFSVALGRFVKLNQLVDHEAHRNVKKVVDPLTSEVLREVDEPLSKHQNRGSAKPRDP